MLIDAAKKVRSAMYIEHYSFSIFPARFSSGIIPSHLNPLCLQHTSFSSPLPPLLTPNLIHTSVSQLSNDSISRFGDTVLRNVNLVDLDPVGTGHPLRSESLDVFDSVVRGVEKELADQIYTLMVRDMSRRLLMERLSIEVLQSL